MDTVPVNMMGPEELAGWQEDSPGIYSRSLDEIELYYLTDVQVWSRSGHTASAITAQLTISLQLTYFGASKFKDIEVHMEKSFEYAWKRIRYECPLLATTIRYDEAGKPSRRVYQVPDDEALKNWLDNTVTVFESGKSSHDFVASNPPVPYAAIFAFPHQILEHQVEGVTNKTMDYDIVFRCGYDVMDGMATYSVLANLLQELSRQMLSGTLLEVKIGDEHKYLRPTIRTLLNLPDTPFTEDQIAEVRKQRVLDRASAMTFTLKGKTIPGCTHRATLHFDEAETKAVLAACKTYSTTVTQVFHTAIALALRNLQPPSPEPKEGKYVSYIIMNLRRFCTPPYNSPQYSTMLCHTNSTSLLVVSVPLPTTSSPLPAKQSPIEFLSVLQKVKEFYVKYSTPDLVDAVLCFAARTPEYAVVAQEIPIPDSRPSVSLSSRRVTDAFIKHEYEGFEVRDPWAVGTEQNPAYGVSLSTWKGCFSLRTAYNDAFHEEGEVNEFLESVRKIVLEGMGVK